jgi:hypothetical protein
MSVRHPKPLCPQWQLDLVRDAISGLLFQIPRADVMFVPFLDCVSLLHQQRVVYALWKQGADGALTCRRVFMDDPTYLVRFTQGSEAPRDTAPRRRLAKYVEAVVGRSSGGANQAVVMLPPPLKHRETWGISLHLLAAPQSFLDPGAEVMLVAQVATEQARQLLQVDEADPLFSESVRAALYRTAVHHARPVHYRARSRRLARSELSPQALEGLLAPMRQALNAILGDVGRGDSSLRIRKNGLPNIFAVVRLHSSTRLRYRNQFDYTCRFLVLDGLRNWLQDMGRGSGESPESDIALLETPLDAGKRSIADHVFSNETLTFRLDPLQEGLSAADPDHPACADDWSRSVQRLEAQMYPKNANIMYVPIHVCLTPWITLYTLTPADSENGDAGQWHHNYLFYRELVHGVADQIRSSAASVYLAMLAKCLLAGLRDVYTTAEAATRGANRAFEELAQVYPFPMGHLNAVVGSGALSLGNLGSFTLSLYDNPFFSTRVEDCGFTLEQAVSQCQAEVHAFLEREQRVASRGVADATHLLKYQLDRLLTFVSEGKANEARAVASNLLLLHDVAEARLNVDKLDALKAGRRLLVKSVRGFCTLVQEQYLEMLALLRQSNYNGTLAGKVDHLYAVLKSVEVICEIDRDRSLACYDFLITAFLEGLATNAVANMDVANPAIGLRIRQSGEHVLLDISNSVHPSVDLTSLLLQLNHTGSNGIGVAQMRWLSEAFWPLGAPPVWTSRMVGGFPIVTGSIQLGEMQ